MSYFLVDVRGLSLMPSSDERVAGLAGLVGLGDLAWAWEGSSVLERSGLSPWLKLAMTGSMRSRICSRDARRSVARGLQRMPNAVLESLGVE